MKKLAKQIGGLGLKFLGGALGGGYGAMAGKLLANELGWKPDELEDKLQTALIEQDPGTIKAIREAEARVKEKMLEAGVKLEDIMAKDRDSARRSMLAAGTAWFNMFLTMIILTMTTGWLYWIITLTIELFDKAEFDKIDVLTTGIFATVTGWLLRECAGQLHFWSGSSSGSKQKTEQMSNGDK